MLSIFTVLVNWSYNIKCSYLNGNGVSLVAAYLPDKEKIRQLDFLILIFPHIICWGRVRKPPYTLDGWMVQPKSVGFANISLMCMASFSHKVGYYNSS